MENGKYRVDIVRGFNPDLNKGYYKVTFSTSQGNIIFASDAFYTALDKIYLCDIAKINIHELGADLPKELVHGDVS